MNVMLLAVALNVGMGRKSRIVHYECNLGGEICLHVQEERQEIKEQVYFYSAII